MCAGVNTLVDDGATGVLSMLMGSSPNVGVLPFSCQVYISAATSEGMARLKQNNKLREYVSMVFAACAFSRVLCLLST